MGGQVKVTPGSSIHLASDNNVVTGHILIIYVECFPVLWKVVERGV